MLILLLVESFLLSNGRFVVEIEDDFVVLAVLSLDQGNVAPFLFLGFADAQELIIMKAVEAEPLFGGVVHYS